MVPRHWLMEGNGENMQLIDLSHAVRELMPVYPGDDPVRLGQTRDLIVDKHVNHRLETGMHCGTHLDGPAHLLPSSLKIFDVPLDRCCGRACLLDVRGQSIIGWREEYDRLIQPSDIVLLYTGWDQYWQDQRYFAGHPVVETEFGVRLAEKGIKILGLDTPSPDRPPFPVHKLLLSQQILIMENLTNLHSLLDVDQAEVFAFPLSLAADSSPLRVVARIND